MQTSKLKQLNRSLQQLLLQPLQLNPLPSGLHTAHVLDYTQYQGCNVCNEVRRQNYRLKQEVLRMEVVEDELEKARKEVAALKELGELKDKEVELLRRRLEESEARFEEDIEERERQKERTVRYFQKLLSQNGS